MKLSETTVFYTVYSEVVLFSVLQKVILSSKYLGWNGCKCTFTYNYKVVCPLCQHHIHPRSTPQSLSINIALTLNTTITLCHQRFTNTTIPFSAPQSLCSWPTPQSLSVHNHFHFHNHFWPVLHLKQMLHCLSYWSIFPNDACAYVHLQLYIPITFCQLNVQVIYFLQ